MEQVEIRIGPVTFDHADQVEHDVLNLHVDEPQEGEGGSIRDLEVRRCAMSGWRQARATALLSGNVNVVVPALVLR